MNDPEPERILQAFSEHAMRAGIRAVNMGELARQLQISPTTLYKHFPSKADLVAASVEHWAHTIAASQQVFEPAGASAEESFGRWLKHFAAAGGGMSREFVRDLRKYPDAWERFREANRESKRRGARVLRPLLRDDIDEGIALAVCGVLIDHCSRPDFAERLEVSRSDAIRTALGIWARGALKFPPRGS